MIGDGCILCWESRIVWCGCFIVIGGRVVCFWVYGDGWSGEVSELCDWVCWCFFWVGLNCDRSGVLGDCGFCFYGYIGMGGFLSGIVELVFVGFCYVNWGFF